MKHASSLVCAVVACLAGSGCIITAGDERGPRVDFAELDAVKADAPADARVAAAGKAVSVEFKDVVTVDEDGFVLVADPVGTPPVVNGQAVWWLEDLKPLVQEGSEADKDIDAHLEARGDALAYDNVFNTGSAIITGALAVSAVGLVWLLFLDGGDPAFYVTLGASGGGAAASVATFASWYALQLPHSIDARNAKLKLYEHWNDGVAARYGVKVEAVEGEPGKVNVSAQ
jgi:hypothetical protein